MTKNSLCLKCLLTLMALCVVSFNSTLVLAMFEEIQEIGDLDKISGPIDANDSSCQPHSEEAPIVLVRCRLSPNNEDVYLLVDFRKSQSTVLWREGQNLISSDGISRQVVSGPYQEYHISPSGNVVARLRTRQPGHPEKWSVWIFDATSPNDGGNHQLLIEELSTFEVGDNEFHIQEIERIYGGHTNVAIRWRLTQDSPTFSAYLFLDVSSGSLKAFPNDFAISIDGELSHPIVQPFSGRAFIELFGKHLGYVYQSHDPFYRIVATGTPSSQQLHEFPSVPDNLAVAISHNSFFNDKILLAPTDSYGDIGAAFVFPTETTLPFDSWWIWFVERSQKIAYQHHEFELLCQNYWREFKTYPLPNRKGIIHGWVCIDGSDDWLPALINISDSSDPQVLVARYGLYHLDDSDEAIEIDSILRFTVRRERLYAELRDVDSNQYIVSFDLCSDSLEWHVGLEWDDVSNLFTRTVEGSWQLIRRYGLTDCLQSPRLFRDMFQAY